MPDSGAACWRNPRILLPLVVILFSGAVAGALAMRLYMRDSLKRQASRTIPYIREGGKDAFIEKMRKELALSDAQADQLRTVVADFVMYYQMLEAQMDEVRSNGKQRILLVLNPDQRARFEKMIGEMQARQGR